MAESPDTIRYRIRVEGRVQGVWFRDSTRERAWELGVNGWVRNLLDGSVEAVAEGTPAAVNALLMWMRHGPDHAVVTHVDVQDEPPRGENGFRVTG